MRATAISLMIACVCVCAEGGTYSGGSGTSDNPYLIGSAADIIEMSNTPGDWGAYFRMIANIDMAGYTFTRAVIAPDTDDAKPWFQGTAFTGLFDGGGHVIRHLSIDATGAGNDYLGLFGQMSSTTKGVRNLGVEEVNVKGGDGSFYFGALCGANKAVIRNCYSSGMVTGGNDIDSAGGLCGDNYYQIFGSHSSCTVRCGDNAEYVGGLCGWNANYIYGCNTNANVSAGSSSVAVGGLCGWNDGIVYLGQIIGCYSVGEVSAGDNSADIGGLCGENAGWFGQEGYPYISYCYSNASVTGGNDSSHVGGLCGSSYSNYSGSSVIRNSYSSGSVQGGSNVGGFCGGSSATGSITACFWDAQTAGVGNPGDNSYGAIGKTTEQMQTKSTFTGAGWNFSETWGWLMCREGKDYPRLRWQGCPISIADLNVDGEVNLIDFGMLGQEWERVGDGGKLSGGRWGVQFDGVNDYVQISGYKAILGGASRAVCAWIKVDGAANINRAIMSWGNDNTGGSWLVMLDDGGLGRSGALRVGVSGGTIAGKRNLADGQWHHIAAVLDSDGTPDVSEVLLYADGAREELNYSSQAAIDTGSAAGGLTSNDVRIGAWHRAGSEMYFNGVIDDVRVYDRALSEGEIMALASGQEAGYPVDAVAYWPFDGDAGDASGNGHDGVLVNGATLANAPGDIPAGVVTVDGDLSEWGEDVVWIALDKAYYEDASDVAGARFALRWNPETDKIYAAVVVEDGQHWLTDEYVSWDASDRIELYCQGDAAGGTGWNENYDAAQQYMIGMNGAAVPWAAWGRGYAIGGDAGLEYATAIEGTKLIYEAGVQGFDNYGGRSGGETVISELGPGDVVAFDVIASSRWSDAGFGMLSENTAAGKHLDAGNIARYTLGCMLQTGDLNGDCAVDLADLWIFVSEMRE